MVIIKKTEEFLKNERIIDLQVFLKESVKRVQIS